MAPKRNETGQPPRLDEHLLELVRPTVRYRTPAAVRAIPNSRWEEWLRTDTVPFAAFSASSEVQRVLRTLLRATRRRMVAGSGA